MFDQEGYEDYVRQKIGLERKLEETGGFRPGSTEIKTQMHFIQERLLAKIKQVYYHAAQEMDALRMVLTQSCKDEEGGK